MDFMVANIKLNIDLAKTKANLKKVQQAFKKSVDTMKKVASKLTDVFKNIFAKIAKFGKVAFVALAAFIGLSIAAAIKQEDAMFKLEVALRNVGVTSKEVNLDFQEFASTLQELTVLGDESILALIQMESSLGVATESLKFATIATIGLSAALNVGEESMAKYVALALQGEFTMLNRYIPALRTAKTEQEKFNIFLENSKRGFEIARAEAQTTSGSLKQLKNTIGDIFFEITGAAFLEAIQNSSSAIKKWAENNRENVQKFADVVKVLLDRFTSLGSLIFTDPSEFFDITGDILASTATRFGRDLETVLTPIFKKLGSIIADAIIPILPKVIRPQTLEQLKKERLEINKTFSAIEDLESMNRRQRVDFTKEFPSFVLTRPDGNVIKNIFNAGTKTRELALKFLNKELDKLDEKIRGRVGKAAAAEAETPILDQLKRSSNQFKNELIPLNERLDEITAKREERLKAIREEEKKIADEKAKSVQKELESGAKLLSQQLQQREEKDKQKNLLEIMELAAEAEIEFLAHLDAMQNKLTQTEIFIGNVFESAAQGIEMSFSNAFESMIQGTEDFRDAFTQMATGIKNAMIRAITDMIARWVVFQALSGFVPTLINPFTGKTATPRAVPTTPGQGIPSRALAIGGITAGPTLAGEAGPEAVVPLPNGRQIPVDLQGSASPKVQVNVINQTTSEVEAEEGNTFFDGEKLVTEVFLKDVGTRGPMSQAIEGIR